MQDKTYELTMLLDFYGELLTEKQRECFVLRYNDDLSLGEIAEILNISRQGVRDLLVRAEAALRQVEEKTGLVRRFSQQREIIENMALELNELKTLTEGRAALLTDALAKELESIRT